MARARSEPESPGLGLFGGTFNPIHVGHLLSVQEVADRLDLERVLFIPTHRPPHKDTPEVPTEHRLEMTRRAIQSNDRFEVSDLETELEGPSYSFNTVKDIRSRYPNHALFFLTGADELIDFPSWHRWRELLDMIQLVGMNRPGFPRDQVDEEVRSRTTFVEVPSVDVSSSGIRSRRRQGRPIRYFVPESVWEFITKNDLYSRGSA